MTDPLAFVIEDDELLGESFHELLTMVGWQVRAIHDGQAALTQLAETTPDLVVLDLHLPHVSGLEILDLLQGDARFEHTHVAIVTADAVRAQALKEAVEFVLVKPVGFDDIMQMATRLLNADD